MRLIVDLESGKRTLRPLEDVEKVVKVGGGTIRYVDDRGNGIAINCEGMLMDSIEGLVVKKTIVPFSSIKLGGRGSLEEMQNFRFSDRVIVNIFGLFPPREKEF